VKGPAAGLLSKLDGGVRTPAVPYAGATAALGVAALHLVRGGRDAPLEWRRAGPQRSAMVTCDTHFDMQIINRVRCCYSGHSGIPLHVLSVLRTVHQETCTFC